MEGERRSKQGTWYWAQSESLARWKRVQARLIHRSKKAEPEERIKEKKCTWRGGE